ncbi:MAG TPA: hypothetical protein PKA95_14055 [Thermomicrobiales bacterium]|mgnify:CR=1 FL=1|nr:hypothetical protein [Thermomicrobiales bacterium]
MTSAEDPTQQPEEPTEKVPATPPAQSASREAILESIGINLLNAGVVMPAADFVAAVRQAAGYRANPREIAVALARLHQAGREVSPDAVAGLLTATRGERSQRQQRHADDWRALGATMSLKGLDGSPEGQRALIGAARAVAGPRATDALLLQIALALGTLNAPFDAATIGGIARRLARSAPDLSPADMPALVRRELGALRRAQRPRATRKSSVGSRRRAVNPGARKLKPGQRRGAGLKRQLRRDEGRGTRDAG